jgi:hypothetical protein
MRKPGNLKSPYRNINFACTGLKLAVLQRIAYNGIAEPGHYLSPGLSAKILKESRLKAFQNMERR